MELVGNSIETGAKKKYEHICSFIFGQEEYFFFPRPIVWNSVLFVKESTEYNRRQARKKQQEGEKKINYKSKEKSSGHQLLVAVVGSSEAASMLPPLLMHYETKIIHAEDH